MGENRNRKAFLRSHVEELLDAGVGRYHWSEIVDKLLEDGDLTEAELASQYGRDGFFRTIIRPVAKRRDERDLDKYLPTKTGGQVPLDMADLDECVSVYWMRKHHVEASTDRLTKLRAYIIDQHEVDPETLPDPTGGREAEDAAEGDDE